MFHHVGISCMIAIKEEINFTLDKHFEEWCAGGPWFNETIFHNLHGPLFE